MNSSCKRTTRINYFLLQPAEFTEKDSQSPIKHTADDYIAFLKRLNRQCPKDKTLHIVTDNYRAHKTKEVRQYLDSKPVHFVEHFIPTHSSWFNLTKQRFGEITSQHIRRESWDGAAQLEKAIDEYITQ